MVIVENSIAILEIEAVPPFTREVKLTDKIFNSIWWEQKFEFNADKSNLPDYIRIQKMGINNFIRLNMHYKNIQSAQDKYVVYQLSQVPPTPIEL